MTDIMIDDLVLELVSRQQIVLDNQMPEQNAESDTAVADSIQTKPNKVDLRVKITPERGEFVTFLTDEQKEQSIQEQWDRLKEIRNSREPFTYTSPELTIDRAQIMSLGLVESNSFSYEVNLSIKELTFEVADESQQGEQQAGRRSDQETSDEAASDKASSQSENWIKLDPGPLLETLGMGG